MIIGIIRSKHGITTEWNISLKIETAVAEQLGSTVFHTDNTHYFEHHIGQQRDHLSSLMRLVTRKYLNLRLKTYGKLYTEFVVQKNMPSIRHELNKTNLFRNMKLLGPLSRPWTPMAYAHFTGAMSQRHRYFTLKRILASLPKLDPLLDFSRGMAGWMVCNFV